MAEHFSFFDPVIQSDGTFDREYNAQQFTNYFKTLVTTGILKGERNELKLTVTETTMQTKIDTGVAYILGRYYENDSIKELTHDTESLGLSRIDRVVIRMDLNTEARYVKSFIKKGAPSTNPVPPTLVQTPNVYEISLAQVRVVGGQTFIAANAITDERGTNVICPWAGSNILPSFDDNALAEHIKTKATTTQEGHVQLNDTLTSTSTTQAATANAVKRINDKFIVRRTNAVLESGWINFENPDAQPLTYYKDAFGVVHLYGNVRKMETLSLVTIMPVGYRPVGTREFIVQNGAVDVKPLFIYSDGKVQSYYNDKSTNIIIDVSYPTT